MRFWKQYEIVLVNLDPTIGSEIHKTRPCVIVSPDEMNRHLATLVVCPVTSSSKAYPTRVPLVIKRKSCWMAVDQIRTISKERVIHSMGFLKPEAIIELKAVIQETFVD